MDLATLWALVRPYQTWFWTGCVVLGGALVYAIAAWLIQRIREPKTRITLGRVAGAVVVFFVLVGILAVWVHSATVFLLVAGLVSAGLAFSLQGPLTSLVAWLVLLVLKPFEIGDRIQIGAVTGDVVGYNPFFFSILEIGEWSEGDLYTGRQVEVPNNQIMGQSLVNYSRNFGFLWDTVVVGIYYEADWARARALLLGIAERASATALAAAQRELERFRQAHFMPRGRLEPQVFVSFASTTINLSVRYVTDVWNRPWTRSGVVEAVLREFGAAGIDLAYPSVVVRTPEGAPPGPAPLAPPRGARDPSLGSRARQS